MKLLVIEDSSRLRRSLEQGFKKAGFSVRLTGDGKDGLAMLDADEYDVVVLDLMLPGMPGLEVLQRLRREGRDTHVLILSAKDQVSDRIRALELGADDYLVKPFSFDELCARVNALVRRRYHAKNPRIVLGHVEIDTARKSVTVGGHVEHLTPSEYAPPLSSLVLAAGARHVPGPDRRPPLPQRPGRLEQRRRGPGERATQEDPPARPSRRRHDAAGPRLHCGMTWDPSAEH
ncbi:MAG: response regulator transcription factor [Acidobacteriota bacterium]